MNDFLKTLEKYSIELNINDKQALKKKFEQQNGYLPIQSLVKNITLNFDTCEWELKLPPTVARLNLGQAQNKMKLRKASLY